MPNYQLKSNLSEKQLEADISSYFGWISKGTPFRLLDIDEQITGADKKYYDAGFAYFMQFKVSKGLKSIRQVPASTRKGRSKLEDVREFRRKKLLHDDPTLYFELRNKAKTADDFQHNVLMKYANKPCSEAFYVAPLHLDKTVYFSSLFDSVLRYRHHPFDMKTKTFFQNNWVSYIGHIPFLKEHVSIIPHEHVDTHKHYYSFSETGTDIAWHSPEVLSENPSRLSDVLSRSIEACLSEGKLVNLSVIEKILDADDEYYQHDGNDNFHPIERIQSKARSIYKKHRIRLVLFLGNKEYVSSLQTI